MNVILTFPTNKGFDCFDGDVVQYNGDIVATTDYGFFFDDPDVKNFSGGSTAGIFAPGAMTGHVSIDRANSWELFEFLTPISCSTVAIYGGNYTTY